MLGQQAFHPGHNKRSHHGACQIAATANRQPNQYGCGKNNPDVTGGNERMHRNVKHSGQSGHHAGNHKNRQFECSRIETEELQPAFILAHRPQNHAKPAVGQPAAEQICQHSHRQNHIILLNDRQQFAADAHGRQAADAIGAAGILLLIGEKHFNQGGQRQCNNVEEYAFHPAAENKKSQESGHRSRHNHPHQNRHRRIMQNLHEPGNLRHAKSGHKCRNPIPGRIRQGQHVAAQPEENRLPQIHQARTSPQDVQRERKNNVDNAFAHHFDPE